MFKEEKYSDMIKVKNMTETEIIDFLYAYQTYYELHHFLNPFICDTRL